jgi:ribonuclease P protein component
MQRRFRLRQPADFETLRRHGRRWRHPLLTMVAVANDRPITRFAFAANKRVGMAVARNRAKRLLREAARAWQPAIAPGWDLLFVAQPETPSANLQAVWRAMGELLARAQLRQPGSEAAGATDNRAP